MRAPGRLRGAVVAVVVGLVLPRPAHACTCPAVGTAVDPMVVFPTDGSNVPPNAHFWVFLPRNSSGLVRLARLADPDFAGKTCPLGDPLCGLGDGRAGPPKVAGTWKYPARRWPDSPGPLQPFLWRWPETEPPSEAHAIVETRLREGPRAGDRELLPIAPLEEGMRYAIAVGPTAELAFPFAIFHARGLADVTPPSWDGPQVDFVSAEKLPLGSCGDGGQLTARFDSLRDAPNPPSGEVLFRLESSRPHPWVAPEPAALVTTPRPALLLGVRVKCVPPLLAIPQARPFDLDVQPIDAAGNEGQRYRITVDETNAVRVTPGPALVPAAPTASARVATSPARAAGPPPRLRRYGPALLAFIAVFAGLRLVWRRHRARGLDGV